MGNGREQPDRTDWIGPPDDSINNGKKRQVKRTKPKPLLKCHYCMLSYNSEKERSEHEALWHTEKTKGL
ncbi:hypothetical protein [Nitrososphaera sp.]|uniref:hypothetical protein n=1 Tax=Nitrososphaera sp. TaxID=1971748 RepID=UPI00317EE425